MFPNITLIELKLVISLGVLWVNKFKLAKNLRSIPKKFNKNNTDHYKFFKRINQDLQFTQSGNQGIRMGDTGITYQCYGERYDDTGRVIICL